MKLFRYILLILILCSIPSIVLVGYGNSAGSMLSYLTYGLLLVYYFISKKHKLAWPFIIFAFTFYLISGVIYIYDEEFFYYDFIKYLVLIICGGELARKTNIKELIIILLIGASSVIFHAAFWTDDYGRYSGFYLDPNSAGFACLLGCAASFSLKSEKWKIISLAIFTFCGALTFSRTFFVLWFILIIVSIFSQKRNVKILSIGVGALLLLISVTSLFQLNTDRLSFVDSIINTGSINQSFTQSSRTETWAKYYDLIFESPVFGNGYQSFVSDNIYSVGVHNNYLRIIGEAGLIPFLIFIGIYAFLFIRSLKTFKSRAYLTLLAISLAAVHLTNHNFNTINHVTFLSIWLYFKLTETDETNVDHENELLDTIKH